MADIFISYASEDRARARAIAQALEQQWSVWWDRTILPGDAFDRTIERALESAKCVVVLWSASSVSSDWVRTEAGEGARRGILVPAFIEEVEIPLAFKLFQAADLSDWQSGQPHAEFEKLNKAIQTKLEASTGAESPDVQAGIAITSRKKDANTRSETQVTSQIRLNNERYGRGDPILCIHGLGASLYSWRNFVDALSKQNEVILLDLKGSGESPKPKDNYYSTQNHADLIYGFVLEHDLRNLTLIGSSFGGTLSLLTAIMLTERDPGRLRSLILIDAGAYKKALYAGEYEELLPWQIKLLQIPIINYAMIHLIPAKYLAKSILRLAYYDRSKITGRQIEAYARPLDEPGGRHALLETGKQIIPPNINEIWAKYKNIAVPTLIIWGKQDRVMRPIVGELLEQAIPNSTLKTIDQCGHIPQEERPEATISLVLDFLQSL